MFTCMSLTITYHVSLINHNVPSEKLLYERDGINNLKKPKKTWQQGPFGCVLNTPMWADKDHTQAHKWDKYAPIVKESNTKHSKQVHR